MRAQVAAGPSVPPIRNHGRREPAPLPWTPKLAGAATTNKQQHDDAVDIDSPTVGYTYAIEPMASGNFSRQTELVYPDGWILETTYGASGSIDDRISRAATLRDEDTSDVYAGYVYIGSGTPAIVEYEIPGVRLSRFHADNGTSATGQYPGLDRFGRLARQIWTDATFGPHGSVGTVPNRPPIVALAYTYDNASSRTGAFDARPGAAQPLSHMYAYDGLHRLIDARRGVWDGDLGTPSVTQLKNSQEWSLDPLGNWDAVGTAAGSGIVAGDIETRDHRDAPTGNPENRVNKLMSRTLSTAAGGDELALDYDFAGNMLRQELTDEPTALVFTHDAWNRLVKVQFEDDEEELHDRGEYEYNGLNWRTVRRFDSNVANTTHALDTEQVLLYDADWRLLERRVNSTNDPMEEEPEIDRIIHHVWGLRYIDDIVATRHDINPSAENGHELIFFHITDAQFSTVAMLSDTGAVLERVTYTAYGVARHHWPTDVTGDGEVDSADLGAVLNAYGSIDDPEYRSGADFDRDGVVGGADLGAVLTYLTKRPDGVLSADAVNNEIGYAGYQFAPEAGALGAYLARNRWLDPELGRWRQRDPLGYVDGMGLYEYVGAAPLTFGDSHGQWRFVPGMGHLSGQLGPGASGAVSSDFHLNFQSDREAFREGRHGTCCAEVRFVQMFYVDARKGRRRPGLGLPQGEWTVDADQPPYYPHGSWRAPRKGGSNMFDTPSVTGILTRGYDKFDSIRADFEVCAVCSKSQNNGNVGVGDVFCCVEWGHSFLIAGARWNRQVTTWKRYVDSVTWGSGMPVRMIEERGADGSTRRTQRGGGSGAATYVFKGYCREPSREMASVLTEHFP